MHFHKKHTLVLHKSGMKYTEHYAQFFYCLYIRVEAPFEAG